MCGVLGITRMKPSLSASAGSLVPPNHCWALPPQP
jgi:hypothetical protein